MATAIADSEIQSDSPASVLDLVEAVGDGIAEVRRQAESLAERNLRTMGSAVADTVAKLASEAKDAIDSAKVEVGTVAARLSSLEAEARSSDSRMQKSLDSLAASSAKSLEVVRGRLDSLADSLSASIAELKSKVGELVAESKSTLSALVKAEAKLDDYETRISWLEAKFKILTRKEVEDKDIVYSGGLPVKIHSERKFGE